MKDKNIPLGSRQELDIHVNLTLQPHDIAELIKLLPHEWNDDSGIIEHILLQADSMPDRFVTIENNNGEIIALTEDDNHADVINDGDTACWVWQYALNKDEAIKQHPAKHDLWAADQENNTEKETY